jgi:orotidine-5'-phosphate decarboxylase
MTRRPQDPRKRIIVALDVAEEAGLLRLLDLLRGRVGMFKIGKELFTALGPRAISLVHDRGGEVFLDLKYHDIPNTVAGAVRSAARLGVSMLTVHASGGTGMLRAAVDAAGASEHPPAVVAVTLLTSLGPADVSALGFFGQVRDVVLRLAGLSLSAGADGLVASPRELLPLREEHGLDPLLVTPGVRPAGGVADDQARIATPQKAVQDGADYLVIGRPITRDPDPAAAADRIAAELSGNPR